MHSGQQSVKEYFDNQYSEWEKDGAKDAFYRGFWYEPCQREVLDRIGNLDGKKVLILGVGRGNEVKMLCTSKASIVAIDVAPSSFDKNENGELVCADCSVKGYVMDAQQMSFADGSFDIVYLQSMMCHVDKIVVAREVSRILKPGGLFVLLDERNNNSWARLYRKIFSYRSATPYDQFMSEADIAAISKCFNKEIYAQRYYSFTLVYYLIRIVWARLLSKSRSGDIRSKLAGLIEKARGSLLGFERKIVNRFPYCGRNSLIWLTIFEK